MANAKVVGGQYMDAMVMLTSKGGFALQVPMKFKKVLMTADTVTEWEELATEPPSDAASGIAGIGRAVAGAVLPGFAGKVASAAIGSTLDSTRRPPRRIRVDWMDGKQSILVLPEKMFTHFAVVLKDRKAETVSPTLAAEMKFAEQSDVTEQIGKLAALRDQGILTEDEFVAKKIELLGRL